MSFILHYYMHDIADTAATTKKTKRTNIPAVLNAAILSSRTELKYLNKSNRAKTSD